MIRKLASLRFRKVIIAIAVIILLIGGLIGFGSWYTLFRMVSDPYHAPGISAEARYKYGSIGTEFTVGIPYWIWLVLPRIFPEYLPGLGGYAALGMVWEVGQEMPIGIPKLSIGIVPRVGINCALCHTATYRKSAAEVNPIIVPGGPAQRFDLLAYQKFLFASVSDPRFSADTILDEISKIHKLSWFEKLLYRYLVIPRTKSGLLANKQAWEWVHNNPDWGPGRIDPFNPVKFGILGQPVDGTIGNSDMMSVWNLKNREGMVLHWDGLNRSIREVVLSSAIGDGSTPKSLDLKFMTQIEDYLKEMPPPKYPFDINEDLALEGKKIFESQCAACHIPGQGRTGQVIPVSEVGTDRHRVDMWGQKDADAYMEKYRNYQWGFQAFQNIDGYVAIPLYGLWLRAPYLHNGSVPTLKDLLEIAEGRPKLFYRGYDVYDPEKVGFLSDLPKDEHNGLTFFRYDTTLPGNSNEGHLYGTSLSNAEKKALIEYLKKQ